MVDIVIPLGGGSKNNNKELKLTLRSIEKYTNVNNIYVVTTEIIPWLRNVIQIPVSDRWNSNKDKNIINKIVVALQRHPEIDDFVLWMDDFIITKPVKLEEFPRVYNSRSKEELIKNHAGSKWHDRLINTLKVLELIGFDSSCNWEAHVPAKFNRNKIVNGIVNINYESVAANYTIFTLFAYLCDYTKEGAYTQNDVKYTYESKDLIKADIKADKLFIGFNDAGFSNGVGAFLEDMFPDKSKYEITVETMFSASTRPRCVLAKNVTNRESISRFVEQLGISKYVLLPLDKVSYNTLVASELTTVGLDVTDDINEMLKKCIHIAKYIADQSLVYDETYSYGNDYIADLFNDTRAFGACIRDTNNKLSTLIVNNKAVDDIIYKTDTNDVIKFIEDNVRPIILIN